MSKKSVLWIILDLIFLAVFNTVFFVAGGFDHPASVWISYGFIHFSYLMVIITPFLIRKSSSAAVFGFSLYSISSAYFLLEFVVGLIFILIKSDSFKAALVVQIIIAGFYGVLLISNLIANESTAESVERQEAEVAYIKNAASRVKALIGKSKDKKANKEIEKTYDLLHSSPTRSVSSARQLELQVVNYISDLEDAVQAGNIDLIIISAGKIIETMEERNRKLRLSS